MTIETIRDLSQETIDELQNLYASAKGSESFYREAAKKVDSGPARALFDEIAYERNCLADDLRDRLFKSAEETESEGTFKDSAHELWTKLRATINAGNLRVLLIETERAEDRLLDRYKSSIEATPGSPLNALLLRHFRLVKKRHDEIRHLRDTVN